jgi:hypothetical protein
MLLYFDIAEILVMKVFLQPDVKYGLCGVVSTKKLKKLGLFWVVEE